METAELKKIGEEAAKATEALKGLHAEYKGALENLPVDQKSKLDKIATDVANAVDLGQKVKLAAEAEEQSRKTAITSLENAIKEAKEAVEKGGEENQKRLDQLEVALKRTVTGDKEHAEEQKALSRKAFNEFARNGGDNRRDLQDFIKGNDEFKALSVGSGPDGGFLVTPTMGAMVTTRVYESSPVRLVADQTTISKKEFEFPIDNDEAASGGWVGETQSRPVTDTPRFEMERITVFEQYAEPAVTQTMLDDADFDVEAWLGGKVADKFARVENTAFVLGNGNLKPKGFLLYPNYATPGVYENRKVEQIASGASGALGGYDALISLQLSLKSAYYPNAVWMGRRATLAALMKIKNGDSNPIFDLMYNGRVAEPTILGKPYIMADDMPDVAANALALAFGDFKQGYLIVDRMGIRTLRDPFTMKPFVLFYSTKRVGGDVQNFEAIKLLKISA